MIPARPDMIGLQKHDPHDVARRNPMARKMPISSVRSRTLPIMVTRTTNADEQDHAGYAIEMRELGQHLHAALDHLLDRQPWRPAAPQSVEPCLRSGSLCTGQHLGHGDAAVLLERLLGGGEDGKRQMVVLGARGLEDPETVRSGR
jgi:hypothetical protein